MDSWKFALDPVRRLLSVELDSDLYRVSEETLRAIWFRRAIYPRDCGRNMTVGLSGQIARIQWAAFLRGLMVFQTPKWINHPQSTYLAEQKPIQLALASEVGFKIPKTLVTNSTAALAGFKSKSLILKGIDTVLASEQGREYFAFAESFGHERALPNFSLFPVIVQEEIAPKVDIRITVIEDRVFAAEITRDGGGLTGDWRKQKSGLTYSKYELPSEIQGMCIAITKRLNLKFGAIDLARSGEEFTFFEINPTGEWSWLVDAAGLEIDRAIADALNN